MIIKEQCIYNNGLCTRNMRSSDKMVSSTIFSFDFRTIIPREITALMVVIFGIRMA